MGLTPPDNRYTPEEYREIVKQQQQKYFDSIESKKRTRFGSTTKDKIFIILALALLLAIAIVVSYSLIALKVVIGIVVVAGIIGLMPYVIEIIVEIIRVAGKLLVVGLMLWILFPLIEMIVKKILTYF